MTKIIKKDGSHESFNEEKIIKAVKKSAERVMISLNDNQLSLVCMNVKDLCTTYCIQNETDCVPVSEVHKMVEKALSKVNQDVAESYRSYRNYKTDFVQMLDDVYKKAQSIMYLGDKENSNSDSSLVSTKRSLIAGELSKELYQKFFLTSAERKAAKEGFIYIHDMRDRLYTLNCFDVDTKFITSEGVKSFRDYKDGDIVYVPTHTGSWKKAIVKNYGENDLYEVKLKRGGWTEKTVVVTRDHRWILKNGEVTTNLSVGDKLISTPNISKFEWEHLSLEQKRLWCLGFAYGDGREIFENNKHVVSVRLCNRKNQYKDKFLEAGFSVTQPKCFNGDHHVYMINCKKMIPQMNLEDFKVFTHGFLSADGNRTHVKGGSLVNEFRSVQATGEDTVENIYHLLNKSGYYVSKVVDKTNETTNYGKRNDVTKWFNIQAEQSGANWRVLSIEFLKRDETWCLEVEDDKSFILEGGIVTGNCCLADVGAVMKNGFEMGNIWYNEPKTLDTACDVLGDVIMSMASQQYGGFTVPNIDTVLSYYVEKSYNKYMKEIYDDLLICGTNPSSIDENIVKNRAMSKVRRELEQGIQGLEIKLNTVASSRGDYIFITFSFGNDINPFAQLVSETILKVRKGGQGKKGFEKPVLFPKLCFLYDENIHGEGKELENLFDLAIECSSKCMYPDFLSLSGDGYVSEMYQKYGRVVSPIEILVA